MQVTSPTNWLFSVMTLVVVIVPAMFSARADTTKNSKLPAATAGAVVIVDLFMVSLLGSICSWIQSGKRAG
jgi:hypothetical protein